MMDADGGSAYATADNRRGRVLPSWPPVVGNLSSNPDLLTAGSLLGSFWRNA